MTPRARTMAIVETVAELHRIPVELVMCSGYRSWPIVRARHEAIRTVAEKRPHLSYAQMATFFGCHHTTILFALRRLPKKPKVAA